MASANCAKLFCFSWVVSSELLFSVERNINLNQITLTGLFRFTMGSQFFTELFLPVEQTINILTLILTSF